MLIAIPNALLQNIIKLLLPSSSRHFTSVWTDCKG
jgi:hypothetical protein